MSRRRLNAVNPIHSDNNNYKAEVEAAAAAAEASNLSGAIGSGSDSGQENRNPAIESRNGTLGGTIAKRRGKDSDRDTEGEEEEEDRTQELITEESDEEEEDEEEEEEESHQLVKDKRAGNGSNMRDWKKAIKSQLPYTVNNDVYNLQTTFVTVILVMGICAMVVLYLALPSKNLVRIHDDEHLHLGLSPGSTSPKSRTSCKPMPPYNDTYPLTEAQVHGQYVRYRVALISDLDLDSRSGNHSQWISYLLYGTLDHWTEEDVVKVEFETRRVELTSPISSGGRGMELSELIVYDGKLLSCDDRTGIVYHIVDGKKALPWVILNDGSGDTNKGFKCEWMTVKDHLLYVGGFGKEWTSSTGQLINFDPLWVKTVDTDGDVKHVNWKREFLQVRSSAGIQFPGYMIHESCVWSDVHQKWFFLPRRASSTAYDEVEDERKGTNLLISADESFTDVRVKTIGPVIPTRGFSSFKFLPGTNDRIIIALKSMEDKGRVATYVTVFTIEGKILMPEQKVESASVKYEGIEFV